MSEDIVLTVHQLCGAVKRLMMNITCGYLPEIALQTEAEVKRRGSISDVLAYRAKAMCKQPAVWDVVVGIRALQEEAEAAWQACADEDARCNS